MVGSLKIPSDGSNNLIFLDRVKKSCEQQVGWEMPLTWVSNLNPFRSSYEFLCMFESAEESSGVTIMM